MTPDLLDNWSVWAGTADDVPEEDKPLAFGPNAMEVIQYDRARLAGVSFACERVELNTKAKNSIVMIPQDGTSAGMGFGRAIRFIQVKGRVLPAEGVNFIEAVWYEDCKMNQRMNCPVIRKRSTRVGGNDKMLWYANSIKPVNIALVPHYDETTNRVMPDLWQVVGTSPNFFKG